MSNVYFGVKKTEKFFLDEEKVQFIEFKKLNEGERIRFEDSVNSKLKMNQDTRIAELETKPGTDRKNLILAAVCSYSILLGETAEEKTGSVEDFKLLYDSMDADIAENLYQAILEFNGFKKKAEGN